MRSDMSLQYQMTPLMRGFWIAAIVAAAFAAIALKVDYAPVRFVVFLLSVVAIGCLVGAGSQRFIAWRRSRGDEITGRTGLVRGVLIGIPTLWVGFNAMVGLMLAAGAPPPEYIPGLYLPLRFYIEHFGW